MCGRFSLNITLEQIRQLFSADVVTCEWEPRPEVFPSQQVPAWEAAGEIRDIHDRMPCVLKPEAWEDRL